MTSLIAERIKKLAEANNFTTIINTKLVGLEKESLRILKNGELANNSHPKGLGAALTNSSITTDYAESQLELITKPHNYTQDMVEELFDIHAYIHHVISGNQFLWPYSIPGKLPKPKDILIARYGTSANAKFKELYRLGLSYRYGKTMQLICGIHYNFSFSTDLWPGYFHKLSGLTNTQWDQHAIDNEYMKLIRNYMRVSWIVSYLFGSSPAFNTSFINKDIAVANYLKILNKNTYLAPYGTSLRSSNLGYHNKSGTDLIINYNSLSDYTAGLHTAITTNSADFQDIGLYRRNKLIQINTNLLQIENEYYGVIRPKPQITNKNTPLFKELNTNGIAYIELRNIDLNPYEPNGISYEQCIFLEILIYYCLLLPSAEFTVQERAAIKSNNEKATLIGRQPNLQLSLNRTNISLQDWALDIFTDLEIIADYFDKAVNSTLYSKVIIQYRQLIENSDLTPSALIKKELESNQLDYIDLFLQKAQEHDAYFAAQDLKKLDYYSQLAYDSLQKRNQQEHYDKNHQIDLDALISRYFA